MITMENLKHWCPLAGCIIGMLIAESDLPFFPWGILALILIGLSTVYVVRTLLEPTGENVRDLKNDKRINL